MAKTRGAKLLLIFCQGGHCANLLLICRCLTRPRCLGARLEVFLREWMEMLFCPLREVHGPDRFLLLHRNQNENISPGFAHRRSQTRFNHWGRHGQLPWCSQVIIKLPSDVVKTTFMVRYTPDGIWEEVYQMEHPRAHFVAIPLPLHCGQI